MAKNASKNATKPDRKRLSFLVSTAVKDRLERLVETSENESMTEVLRAALSLYEDALACRLAGGRVLLEDKDGECESIRVK